MAAELQLDSITHVHFIGIGGIGMSGLARLMLHEGKVISGSDRATSAITHALQTEGVNFSTVQEPSNITDDIDMVVYTEAMEQDHPEMAAARALGVPMMNYFEALALVANQYYLIAVAGTHGKTTTTAMLIDVLEEAGYDPTAIVGSLRAKTGTNYRPGQSKYFVVEACEYRRDFLHLAPDVLVITNIEADHLDYYHDLADVQDAFRTLAGKVPADGVIIANATDPQVRPAIEGAAATVLDYKPNVDLDLVLTQPGLHNRMNAAAAQTTATFLDIEPPIIRSALEHFAGTWRRFQYKGDVAGAPVYDDYAHHPTEIRAVIAGAREKYPDRHLTVVFQPHMYSRTHELFDDFIHVLAKADRVVMVPIYAAREANESGVSSEQIIAVLIEQGIDAVHYQTLEAAALAVKESVGAEDVVLVLGAGDVTQIADQLTQ